MALSSCATRSSPLPDVHPLRLAPDLCAAPAAEPPIPDAAGLPQPVTDTEKAAVTAFLNWVADLGDWGRQLQARAAKTTASAGCAE